MTTSLLFTIHHIKNDLTNLTRTFDGATAAGRETLISLATIHDQLNNVTDRIKAI